MKKTYNNYTKTIKCPLLNVPCPLWYESRCACQAAPRHCSLLSRCAWSLSRRSRSQWSALTYVPSMFLQCSLENMKVSYLSKLTLFLLSILYDYYDKMHDFMLIMLIVHDYVLLAFVAPFYTEAWSNCLGPPRVIFERSVHLVSLKDLSVWYEKFYVVLTCLL